MSIVTLNDRAVRSVSAFGSVSGGSMIFIKKLTASSSSTLTFLNGSSDVVFDSTYKEYLFTFKNLHPSANAYTLFQGTTDGSNYNTTITSTTFASYHDEGDSFTAFEYRAPADQAQGTAFQNLNYADSVGTDNDMNMSGSLTIFNPSSTTFVKNFVATCNSSSVEPMTTQTFLAGYFNTTSAITGIQFKQNTGNIDAGDICLYGIL
tara:strand:+ start:2261 stop:2878 length:618 start_codon:yes stop_codon:yes gene_type:complete